MTGCHDRWLARRWPEGTRKGGHPIWVTALPASGVLSWGTLPGGRNAIGSLFPASCTPPRPMIVNSLVSPG